MLTRHADPDWGLRATWRGADAEAKALSLRDAGGGRVLRARAYATASYAQPGRSQATFARGRWQLPADLAQLGIALLGSSRDYGDGRYNRVLGSDFAWATSDTDLLRGHLLASNTTAGFDTEGQVLRSRAESGHKLWLSARRRNADRNSSLSFEDISPRFANDNGFVSQSGIRRATLELELEQQLGQGFVRTPQGQRGYTERNAQTLAVLHFSASGSLRAIAQSTHFLRRPEPSAALLAEDSRSRSVSLVYQHRIGLARILSVGATSAREQPAQRRATELFAKAVLTYQR